MNTYPKRTWIIGNAEGSIGEAVERRLMDMPGSGSYHILGTGSEVDVTDYHKLSEFVRMGGPFEYVIYCAGITNLQWIHELDFEDVYDVLNVNFMGFLRVLQVLTESQGSRGGNIVAIVSDAATSPMRGSISYCSSKAALAHSIRVAARELAPHWRVNGVSPSAVEGTKMTEWIDENVPVFRDWDPEEARKYELSSIPMRRRATKEEVAQVVLDTLFGPKFLTGTIINVTGGK